MSSSGSRRFLGPFNRVEGDLEVRVEVENDHVSKAWVNAPLFRGFEQILQDKDPFDALVYTPRICGICSVSQSVAAATALAAAQGLEPCPNGQIATNLILAAENMADHLTHFYLFFMPDFARDSYRGEAWFDKTGERFKAQTGTAASEILPARAAFLHLTGILAGKWPHSLAIQPGGTTRAVQAQEKVRLLTTIRAFRIFLQHTLFGDVLENVSSIETVDQLRGWQQTHPDSDFGRFLAIADALDLSIVGRANDSFMSYGAYTEGNEKFFDAGVWQQRLIPLRPENIAEDITHSWLNGVGEARHPYQGSTIPHNNEEDGYSWCKAPRLDKRVMEVGAIARQMINGHKLIHDLVSHTGANVRNRVIARLLELALVVPAMENWVKKFNPRDDWCLTANMPAEAQGAGMVEAARGSLGHWLKIKNGHISNYQIIAPTTWNFSPRDAQGQPGALEQALHNTPVGKDQQSSVMIQHVIRSFDPCMVCTVH